MAVKIGDMLVQAGILTNEQLEEALKYQVIYGGKIGTNLIELGYLDESTIASFLSKKLGIPYANFSSLANIPDDTIHLLPRNLVEKYRVVPIELEKNRLTLAMSDPTDFSAIDEISFMTNFSIKPIVTPEVDIVRALEKYYGIKRDLRYISVIEREIEKELEIIRNPEKVVQEEEPPLKRDIEREAEREVKKEKEEEKPKVKEAEPKKREAAPEIKEKPEEIVDLEDELEEAELIQEEARKELIERYSIDDLSRALAEPADREVIADVLIKYLSAEFYRAALFMVRGNNIIGWRAAKSKDLIPNFEALQLSAQEPSVLKTVSEGKSFYLGPITKTGVNLQMINALGGGTPTATLLVPVVIMGKVVNIIYVEGGAKELGDTVVEIQRLANKASMSFEILIFKNKIMMT
ncbi:MAG: general secretion pathway protein GspE [Deltaproteobacteria bacterium]|nr:general secretion pathway protein GspE [Deltaproteobacteria bacterium]